MYCVNWVIPFTTNGVTEYVILKKQFSAKYDRRTGFDQDLRARENNTIQNQNCEENYSDERQLLSEYGWILDE